MNSYLNIYFESKQSNDIQCWHSDKIVYTYTHFLEKLYIEMFCIGN